MIILGIETSCDETAAAVLLKDEKGIQILSNVIASSSKLQEKFGGIIPEQAAREQIKAIIPVIKESLQESGCRVQDIDAIAVTEGPGLIGSLLVGVETAKTLSLVWDKPLIPVNHLLGHFWANFINSEGRLPPNAVSPRRVEDERIRGQKPQDVHVGEQESEVADRSKTPSFPCLGLLVSGGHTDLVLFKNENKYEYLGGTRDDAAGECFDKCARLLGLSYPGGPEISRLAAKGDPKAYKLPRPMIDSDDFDFSFSGLKTAVANLIESEVKSESNKVVGESNVQLIGVRRAHSERSGDASGTLRSDELSDLAASIEQAIIDTLVTKTIKAAKSYNIEQIMVAGGVASNKKLSQTLRAKFAGKLYIPPPYLCTDNAAMIASRAFFEKLLKNPLSLQADPNLSLELDT